MNRRPRNVRPRQPSLDQVKAAAQQRRMVEAARRKNEALNEKKKTQSQIDPGSPNRPPSKL